jgi:hypothetical protein
MGTRVEHLPLAKGFSLVTAPRFHARRSWADRLCLNSGIEREGARVHPRDDWRPPTMRELTFLVRQDPDRESWDAGLVAIPARLRETWWANAGGGVAPTEDGYRRFVGAVLDFLRFKRLPLPARCEADVLASRPDLRGTRLDPTTGELSGLAFSAPASRRMVGTINLGDETTHLIVLHLAAQEMRALLAEDGDSESHALSPSDLVSRFFEVYPEYPLMRISLDPGEGMWFPGADVVHDGWPGAKQGPDVVLTIRGA